MTSDGKQSPERERGVKEKTKDDIAMYDIRHTQYDIRNTRSERGGIGRRARFRSWCPLGTWRFESSRSQFLVV